MNKATLDGQDYHFGWVPDLPDLRDFHFSVPRAAVEALPPKTNNRARFTSPVFDQGRIGSCGALSACGDIEWDGDQANTVLRPSGLFVYYVARRAMGTFPQDSGVSNRQMMKALSQYGWCDEALWPYDVSQHTAVPTQRAFDQGQLRKVDQYLRVPQVLETMKACLAGGDPFVFGFTVYSSLMTAAVKKTGVVPMPTHNDSVLGGHDVLIVDYDDNLQMFVFRNSWSEGWGDGGYGYMPYIYAANPQLSSDFWTIRWKVAPQPSPQPVPPQPPTPQPNPPAPGLVTIHVDVNVPGYGKLVTDGDMRRV